MIDGVLYAYRRSGSFLLKMVHVHGPSPHTWTRTTVKLTDPRKVRFHSSSFGDRQTFRQLFDRQLYMQDQGKMVVLIQVRITISITHFGHDIENRGNVAIR